MQNHLRTQNRTNFSGPNETGRYPAIACCSSSTLGAQRGELAASLFVCMARVGCWDFWRGSSNAYILSRPALNGVALSSWGLGDSQSLTRSQWSALILHIKITYKICFDHGMCVYDLANLELIPTLQSFCLLVGIGLITSDSYRP